MKSKSFEETQKLYEREQKWINDFVPIEFEVVKESRKGKAEGSRKKIVARKRTGEKLDDGSVKRQKIDKQTIVANSTTEAEYVAAANCCGQVLWIQNQMLDYGFNFMNTKIYIDNESTICIVIRFTQDQNVAVFSQGHLMLDQDFNIDLQVLALLNLFSIYNGELELCDKHNMVAYLKNQTGSEGFQEIVDFLNGSHIRNFVPTAVATKSGLVLVNAANKKGFNQKSAAKANNFNKKVYTAKVNNVTTARPEVVVSTTEGKRKNSVKSSACWIWRPTGKVIDNISKDSGSYMPKRFDYVDPQGRLKKAKRTTEISQSSGPIHLVADETVYKEWEDRMKRAATTASSLDEKQDSSNINRTQSMATLNESFTQGTDSGSGPRCQDTILRGAEAQIRIRVDTARHKLNTARIKLVLPGIS
ncbi:hypothetical protein Tco_0097242 [Tanacetum coccineum]